MLSLRGGRGAVPPLTTACAPPFWFTQNTFFEHHVTMRQQTIMGKRIITFKHMPLSYLGDFNFNSTANQLAVQSKRSLRGVSIRRGFAMLCAFTENPRRLYGDCTETVLRMIRSGAVVKVAKVFERQ